MIAAIQNPYTGIILAQNHAERAAETNGDVIRTANRRLEPFWMSLSDFRCHFLKSWYSQPTI